jgi:hypothetical protein
MRKSDYQGETFRKPDEQGRISIGKEHAGETYEIQNQMNGDILLRPVVVIHKQEAWLFNNQEALASVKRGIEQVERGEVHDLGDFTQYLADEEDDDENNEDN